jgi:hypothetical protein
MLAGKACYFIFGGPTVSGRLQNLRCRFYWGLRVIGPSQHRNTLGLGYEATCEGMHFKDNE